MPQSSEWELVETEDYIDVSCPECGQGWSIERYPQDLATATYKFECDYCFEEIAVIMHNVPTFVSVYARGEKL